MSNSLTVIDHENLNKTVVYIFIIRNIKAQKAYNLLKLFLLA